jgi:hypothetical protein
MKLKEYQQAPIEAVRKWRDGLAAESRARGEPIFIRLPEEWFKDIHYFCGNGHVSGNIMLSEEDGDCCLSCSSNVLMGPPIGEAEFAPILKRILANW